MARYVILEFDDNDAAGAFLEVVKDPYLMDGFPDGVKAVALYAKPTRFCECGKERNLIKGASLGWFVCATCKLAYRTWQYPDNLLQPKEADRITFVRKQMLRCGFLEGFESNPEAELTLPSFNKSYQPFRGKR
jgi:hypothetical protein